MYITKELTLKEKLGILSDSAKYDVACTSSGTARKGQSGKIGSTTAAGICHSFSADGRCISLLKILMTNECIFNCAYCINRSSNDIIRTSFTPEEICTLTIEFYRRNYIEGLFLSSGILKNPTYTMALLYQTLQLLRTTYQFHGYIHVKSIPGADPLLIEKTGWLADRMSVNLELPTAEGLKQLAPNKSRKIILTPMKQIQTGISIRKNEIQPYHSLRSFVPAGQSTQMIIGATPENDYQILKVTESLYEKFQLKRVFYSAFVNVNQDTTLPDIPKENLHLREHRLYQADWLLRFYQFKADELLSQKLPHFNPLLDPKCSWAILHPEFFPVEITNADYHTLLRIPGIGPKSASRILASRRHSSLDFTALKKIGVVLKRAAYFITCNGRTLYSIQWKKENILRELTEKNTNKNILENYTKSNGYYRQLSLFDDFIKS